MSAHPAPALFPAPTVQELLDSVVRAMGGPLAATVDTVKAGDATVPVRAVATTFMATVDVLRRAAELGANVVLTHEPTFYNHLDEVSFLRDDPVYRAKLDLLDEAGIVVCRLHDHPHTLARDPFTSGLVEALGWAEHADPAAPGVCTIPDVPLWGLAQHVKARLGLESVRVAGDLRQQCRRVALLVGSAGIGSHAAALQAADVAIVGECREWETFSYAADAKALGIVRAVIELGHQPSEEPGMARVAVWLRGQFPGLPVTHVASGHPVLTV